MSERAWLIEVFRLHYQEQLSQNRIGKQLGLLSSTVNSCFQRAIKAGFAVLMKAFLCIPCKGQLRFADAVAGEYAT